MIMKWVNIILAVLLLLCLAPMPYGYYQVVRFVSMIVFAIMSYRYWNQEKKALAVIFSFIISEEELKRRGAE